LRKRVYIAGPISRGDLAHNINQATAAFVELARAGLAPLCPHWSVYSAGPATPHPSDRAGHVYTVGTAAGHPGMEHADWLGVDLLWVAVADAVLRLPGASVGADAEVCEAVRRGIPVFLTVAGVLVWVQAQPEQEKAA
jgi:hypothetical protein